MSVLLVIALLISCRTPRNLPSTHTSDRMNYSYNLDSIYHYEKDSMAISFRPATTQTIHYLSPLFLPHSAASDNVAIGVRKDSLEQTSGGAQSAGDICGTTTFRTDDLTAAVFLRDTLVIERWHTRFKDHEVVKTDTLKVTEYQTITETQKYIPRFYKWCTLFFWMLIILFLGYLIFRIMKAIYLRQ